MEGDGVPAKRQSRTFGERLLRVLCGGRRASHQAEI